MISDFDVSLLRAAYEGMRSTGQLPHETDEQMIIQCNLGDEVALAVLEGLRAVAKVGAEAALSNKDDGRRQSSGGIQ